VSLYQAPEAYVRQFIRRVLEGIDGVELYEEMMVPYIRLRADYGVESIVIEAEPPCGRSSGRSQLVEYMRKFNRSFGILVDVPTERYYAEYPRPCRDRVGFELYMRLGERYEAVDSREFVVRSGNEAEAISEATEELRRLIKLLKKLQLIGRVAKEPPTPSGIIGRVGKLVENYSRRLTEVLSGTPERARLYFNTWRRSMELVYGEEVLEGVGRLEDLFARLTIYVTWLKCLGATLLEAVLGGGRYTLPMKLYIDGHKAAVDLFWHRKALARFNVNYLFERDEYDWVFDPSIAPQLDGFFRDIGEFLLSIDWSQEVGLDLLKQVYQNIVPREVRRQLGEFYTPDWVAQLILWRALHILVRGGPPSEWMVGDLVEEVVELIDEFYRERGRIPRFVDPTCGSFTFGVHYISSLLRWYSERGPSINAVDFAKQIMESVVGIDLNPVAVITAKVNYLLQIHRLLAIYGGYLVTQPILPILRVDLLSIHIGGASRRTLWAYDVRRRGDDVVLRIPLELLGIEVGEALLNELRASSIPIEEVQIGNLQVHCVHLRIPASIVDKARGLVALARAFTALLDSGIQGFKNEIASELSQGEVEALERFRSTVMALEERRLDSIWHSIVLNYLLAQYVTREKFNLVLGNLPWVNVSKYPEGYSEVIRGIARELNVSPPPQAAKKLDISIPLFAVALRYLAASPSVTALMMPCSVFRGLHGAAWRAYVSSPPHRVVEVWDLEEVKPFEGAENQPGIVFVLKR